jgi:DNA-binding Lrp family transcriptional regulator
MKVARIRAYILIKVTANSAREVAANIRSLTGVESADPTTGPYDIIVVTEGKDLNDIADLVTGRLLTVREVISAVTCSAVKTT